jgi:hypothetical protein
LQCRSATGSGRRRPAERATEYGSGEGTAGECVGHVIPSRQIVCGRWQMPVGDVLYKR